MRTSTAQFAAAVGKASSDPEKKLSLQWPKLLTSALARTNEMPTPSANHGVGLWEVDQFNLGATMSIVANPGAALPSGTAQVFKVAYPSAVAVGAGYAKVRTLPTRPGQTYTLFMQVWVIGGSSPMRLTTSGINYGDPSGTSNGTGTASSGTGAWKLITCTFTPSTYFVDVQVENTAIISTTNKGFHYADILLEQTPTTGVFFDGDGANCFWDSCLGGSVSTQQQSPYFDLTEALSSAQGTASLTTDMPATTRLVEGYPVRGHTIVLSGRLNKTVDNTVTAAWLFDPMSTTSPLHGKDWTGLDGVTVTLQAGLNLPTFNNPELYTVFTGTVDKPSINRKTGDVTLTLMVARWTLSGSPRFPAAVAAVTWLPGQTPSPNIAPGLTALWPLDYMLRAGGIYTSPPPRPNCYGYVSMHGSLWPEVSGPMNYANTVLNGDQVYTRTNQPPTPVWQPGRNVGQVPVVGYAIFPLTQWLIMGNNGQVTMEFEFNSVAGGVAGAAAIGLQDSVNPSTPASSVQVQATNTATGQIQLQASTSRAGTSYAVGTGFTTTGLVPGWHRVTAVCFFVNANSVQVAYYIDGLPLGMDTALGLAGAAVAPLTTMLATSNNDPAGGCAAETFQVFGDPVQLPSPQLPLMASLDGSLNNLTAVPDVPPNTDDWQVIQALCDAEGATAGFDEANTFLFRNRQNIYGTISQATVTCLTQVKELVLETQESARARTVTANAFPLVVGAAQVVWSASQVYGIGAWGTITIYATLPGPTIFVPSATVVVPPGGLTSFTSNGYRASYAPDGTGYPPYSMKITVQGISATQAKITVHNPNGAPVWLVSAHGYGTAANDGQPILEVVGNPIGPAPSTADTSGTGTTGAVVVRSSIGSGRPGYALPDNVWNQDLVSTQAFTDDTLADLYRPPMLLPTFTIVGDSRLQLGDRVTVVDAGTYVTSGFGATAPLNDDVILTAINPTYDSTGGFTQSCVGRLAARPGAWVLGQAGRSELGVTTPA